MKCTLCLLKQTSAVLSQHAEDIHTQTDAKSKNCKYLNVLTVAVGNKVRNVYLNRA